MSGSFTYSAIICKYAGHSVALNLPAATRTASPTMLRQYTVTVRNRPGHSASRGASSMYLRPSWLSMPPQLGTFTGRPKSRKLKLASAMITLPTLMLKITISGAAMFGSTGRTRIRRRRAPAASAAWNSWYPGRLPAASGRHWS